MIEEAIVSLSKGENLTAEAMSVIMEEILTGKSPTPQIVSFLVNLHEKGETIDEITAAVNVMRKFVTRVNSKHKVILDTCGTGGDKSGTFNVSTATAFVASGAGIAVAKHGNRSVSSKSGSADILEALGVNINLSKEKSEQCLNEIGIAFLFAQNFHPAMKYASSARKQIGSKTIFNIIGPLSNPAFATHQLVGVYDKKLLKIIPEVLLNLGTEHALVIHGNDGLDEITTTTGTFVSEVNNGEINEFELEPEDFGIKRTALGELKGDDPSGNAKILIKILQGEKGPLRDMVILNAAAAIYCADQADSIHSGIRLAERSIDSGSAIGKLQLLKEYSNQ